MWLISLLLTPVVMATWTAGESFEMVTYGHELCRESERSFGAIHLHRFIHTHLLCVLYRTLTFTVHPGARWNFLNPHRFVRQSAWTPTRTSWCIQVHHVNYYARVAMKVVQMGKWRCKNLRAVTSINWFDLWVIGLRSCNAPSNSRKIRSDQIDKKKW